MAAADVVGLEIETARGRTVLARDGNGDWALTEPYAHVADQAAVRSLVETLESLEHSRALETWEPSEVGLDRPRATVAIATADGARRSLEVGSEVPHAGTTIVAVAGSEVARVVPAAVWTSLERAPGEWRSRRVFETRREDVVSVRRVVAGDVLELVRSDGGFEIVEPLVDAAEEPLVDDLLSALEQLEVGEFLDPPPAAAETGFEPAADRLELVRRSGESEILELGRERAGGGRYARLGTWVFVPEPGLDEVLARPAEQWRSRSWLRLPVYEVDRLEVAAEGGSTEVVRGDDGWTRDGIAVEPAAVNDFLYAVDEAKAEAFEASAPPADPRMTIRLWSRGGEEVVLELYPATPSGLHPARGTGRAATLLFGGEAADRVFETLAGLR